MPNGIDSWDDEDDDFDNDNRGNGNGQDDGSDLIKTLRKKAKADAKLIAELTTKVDGFTKTQREATAKEFLEKKGVNPKAARLLLKDLDDVNEATIESWLKDNGDLFAPIDPETKGKSAEELANLAELQRQNGLTNVGGTSDNAQDPRVQIKSMKNMEELRAFVQSQQ